MSGCHHISITKTYDRYGISAGICDYCGIGLWRQSLASPWVEMKNSALPKKCVNDDDTGHREEVAADCLLSQLFHHRDNTSDEWRQILEKYHTLTEAMYYRRISMRAMQCPHCGKLMESNR